MRSYGIKYRHSLFELAVMALMLRTGWMSSNPLAYGRWAEREIILLGNMADMGAVVAAAMSIAKTQKQRFRLP